MSDFMSYINIKRFWKTLRSSKHLPYLSLMMSLEISSFIISLVPP